MNCQRIYDQLIERSRTRIPPEGYIEHHHIIPRCMNGSDEKSNIAILTPEEHFVAHVLLVKIHTEVPGLIVAVSKMTSGRKVKLKVKHRKLYGWLKRKHSEYMKECQSGKGNSQYGTMWIHKGIENKKIKKGVVPKGWKKGRQIKQMIQRHCTICNCTIHSQVAKYCSSCRELQNKKFQHDRKNINFPRLHGPYKGKDGFIRFIVRNSETESHTYTQKTLPSCWNWQTEGS